MTAEEYIKAELDAGRLTLEHLAALVYYYQDQAGPYTVPKLVRDGKPGTETRRAIEGGAAWMAMKKAYAPPPPPDPRLTAPFLSCPLPLLKVGPNNPQGRKAVITSGFKTNNPGRPTHNGVDFFYRWDVGDEPKFIGDGGCAGKDLNGNPKWVVPYYTNALAAADGTVQIAGPSPTGYRVWIDHGNGLRSGYFHLSALGTYIVPGYKVSKGTALGPIGHNPKDNDARHLHFEVSPVERYEPLDPERYLIK